MRKILPETAFALALVVAAAVGASAQTSGQLPARTGGEEVIVTQSTSGQELRGRLVELSSESLAILVDGRRVEVPIDNVLRIDGRNDPLTNGAIIGAGVMGGLALLGCVDASAGWCAYAVGINTGLGALIGAGIDALHKGRTPIYIKAGKSGSALQVRIRF